ncbi:MAG: ABC transporter substrate-binding protein, partial [Acidimicrobiales bacterium]
IAVAVKAIKQAGIHVPVFFGSGITAPSAASLLTTSELSHIYASVGALIIGSSNPQVQHFVTQFSKKFGKKPDVFAADMYDATTLFGEAIAHVGTNAAKIRKYVDTHSYTGLVTTYRADSALNMNHSVSVVQYNSAGVLKLLMPVTVPFAPYPSS